MMTGVHVAVAVALLAPVGAGSTTADIRRASARAQTMELVDTGHARRIPVALYTPGRTRPLAIILNGFGIAPTEYAFIVRRLSDRGYAVAAIGLDLPGDAPMASTGDLTVLRRPVWQRGVDSVRFVASALRGRGYASRRAKLLLVGHSNGGDVAMLFATEHPTEAAAVFTLDNRRMAFPRAQRPLLCSIRSNDHPADPGVLPSEEERQALGILLVPAPDLRHDEMFDGASEAQKAEMLSVLDICLAKRAAHPAGPPAQCIQLPNRYRWHGSTLEARRPVTRSTSRGR